MSDSSDRRPVTHDDLRALAVELTDRSHQLQAALSIEIGELARRTSADRRAEVDHLTELALGELRTTRWEVMERAGKEATATGATVRRVERRLLWAIVAGSVAVIIANAVIVSLAR